MASRYGGCFLWGGAAWVAMILVISDVHGNDVQPPLEEIRQALRATLPEEPDEELLNALRADNLDAVLRELDPYARFFFTDTVTRAHLKSTGEQGGNDIVSPLGAVGIGAELFYRDGAVHLSPFPGGALARVGIMDRVLLLAVNNTPVQGLAAERVAELIHGRAGSEVVLTLEPLHGNQSQQVVLVREFFQALSIAPIRLNNTVVLQFRRFVHGKTCAALRASIEFLGPQHDVLYLDLRESAGGDLYEAMDCAALFIPEGEALAGLRRSGRSETTFRSPGGLKIDASVVIFIGPDTASAAEIFAKALQYHERAVLVGRQSFGKCSTQTEQRFPDGSVLRMTNGVVVAPDGTTCRNKGIVPDLEVEGAELYDTRALIQQFQYLNLSGEQSRIRNDQSILRRLNDEGRLTVRALRAWDRLPSKYMRLMLDLLTLELDLLSADSFQIQAWADEAKTARNGPLAPFAAELEELAAYMNKARWDNADP